MLGSIATLMNESRYLDVIRVDFLFGEYVKRTVIIAPEKYASSTVMPTKKTIVIIVIMLQTKEDMIL